MFFLWQKGKIFPRQNFAFLVQAFCGEGSAARRLWC
jgi:hypothetical protein